MNKAITAQERAEAAALWEHRALVEQLMREEARESFWAYRQYMRPRMKKGWFQRKLAHACQQFYEELCEGQRPILVIEAPPQHGKSDTITDFTQWVAGKRSDIRQIYGSFSDFLGTRANLRMQRALDSDRYRGIFPNTFLKPPGSGSALGQRTTDILEFVGQDGSFRNTTVNGSVTGESLDLGFIDDPIKGRAEAQSPTTRDKTWSWLTDDFLTRFSEYAGLIVITTRWHVDDPVGRLQVEFPNVKILNFKAIADEDEYEVVDDKRVLLRRKGEPLFPELKSKEFLLARKKVMTVQSWMSVYQGSPVIAGGDLFPVGRFVVTPYLPARARVVKRVRYWDKAGTKDNPKKKHQGKFTAGVLMARLSDDRFVIEDVVHERLGAFDRETKIKEVAQDDGPEVETWVEQEPGSGGKESAERTVTMLAGYKVYADRVTGDKETRAEPYAAQVQGGNVLMLSALWNKTFLTEHEYFPNYTYKDQVDAAAGAFMKLIAKGKPKAGML